MDPKDKDEVSDYTKLNGVKIKMDHYSMLQTDKPTKEPMSLYSTFYLRITVVPDSKELITNVYLGKPGLGGSESIIRRAQKWGISSTQVKGGFFNRQYFRPISSD